MARFPRAAATVATIFLVVDALADDAGLPAARPGIPAAQPSPEPLVVTAGGIAEGGYAPPAARTVIDGGTAEELDGDLFRFSERLPNTVAATATARNSAIAIRGLGATPASQSLENATALFVDGIYYPRPASLSFDFFDLDAVDVLRGPQGTLYGRNTTAGLLNVTTAPPSFNAERELSVGAGSNGQFRATGMATGPLSANFAYRLSFSHAEHGGTIRNVNRHSDAADRLNDANDYGIRGQVLWQPRERFTLKLIADRSEQDTHCCSPILGASIETQADGSDFPNNAREREAEIGYRWPGRRTPSDRRTDVDAPVATQTNQGGVTAEAKWWIGNQELTALTAWRAQTYDPRTDGDYTALSIVRQFGVAYDQTQFSQELRLASTGRRTVQHLLGLFYFRQRVDSLQDEEFGPDSVPVLVAAPLSSVLGPVLNTTIRAAVDGLHVYQASVVDTESLAAFGQATLQLGEQAALTGGLRYTNERKSGTFEQFLDGGGGAQPALVRDLIQQQVASPGAFAAARREGDFSGIVSFSYHFTPAITAYTSYARGYKSGGINFVSLSPGTDREVGAERVDSFELGLRASFAGNRFLLNSTLYWAEADNHHSVRFDRQTLSAYITNVGRVRVRGIEVEANAALTPSLRASAGVAYNDARILSYPDAPCPPEVYVPSGTACSVDLKGARPEGAPIWTAFVGAHYARPLTAFGRGDLEAMVGADLNYVSGYYTEPGSEFTRVAGRTLVNLRVGIQPRDRDWRFTLWASNLFDTAYATAQSSLPLNLGGTLLIQGDPLAAGATLLIRY